MELIHFQNANSGNDTVVNNFVVRQKEFNRVMDDIRTTKKDSSYHHYVFIGRRGSGKSTLLRRIQAEITIDKTLSKQFEVVNLSEEQSGIYKLYDLWDYVIRALNAIGYTIADIDFRLYKHNMKDYTKVLHGEVIKGLQFKKKRLVLLIDNIDRVLESKGDENDAALLRELLMNFNDIRIIGSSTVMSEEFWKYDKPFYEFFTIKRLEKLSLDEMKLLLNHWSDAKQLPQIKENIEMYPGKLQSIRMLTDGMPRTMLLFIDMLLNRPAQNGFEYLQYIVDKATPIYQERLAQLSPAQNKVITELAFFWDAAGVDQLIPKCKMDGKTISAILGQLVQLRYVEKIKGETKNFLYRIEERFFNLWFNMTQGGPQQKLEAKALTNFLEVWYNKPELEKLCYELADSVKSGGVKQDYAESMTAALLRSNQIDSDVKFKLYNEVNESGVMDMKKLGEPEKYLDLKDIIINEIASSNFENAIIHLNASNLPEVEKHFLLGYCYKNIYKLDKAIHHYKMAINLGSNDAKFNLALIYANNDNIKEAEHLWLQCSSENDNEAQFNLGLLYDKHNDYFNAEKYYLKAIETGYIEAYTSLGIMYEKLNRLTEAENSLMKALVKDDAESYFNLAVFYDNRSNYSKAEKYYLTAINKDYVDGVYNLLLLYYNQNKRNKIVNLIKGLNPDLYNKFLDDYYEFVSILYLYLGNMLLYNNMIDTFLNDDSPLISVVGVESLLIHNQIAWVINYFKKRPEASELHKSLFYVALILEGNNQQDLLKMPPEIKENVSDIVGAILASRQFYYPDET